VLVVEVDRVDAEPLERAFDGGAHVLGAAVDAALEWIVRVADEAEFRRDDELLALALDRLSDELLVGVRAVHVGGVEEVHPELERAMDRGDGFSLVALIAVKFGHSHAAEAHGGCLESLCAEFPMLHSLPWASVSEQTNVRPGPSLAPGAPCQWR
jgi:hypothetical protein